MTDRPKHHDHRGPAAPSASPPGLRLADLDPLAAPRRIVEGLVWLLQVVGQGRLRYAVFAGVGVCLGIGGVALQTSNARSYLSDSPETCINCHVMTPYYAGWARSSHRTVATCGDCHVPHDNALKGLYFKAMDGLRHATVFTARREPQTLKLNPAAVPVVQKNCVRCHEPQIMNTSMRSSDSKRLCWECHRETPHGLAQSLSSTPHVRRPMLPSAGIPRQRPRPAGVPRKR
jgi:cytochrome c nitrite reductase small subunit